MSSTTGSGPGDAMYTHRIVWSGGADSAVVATGQFDDWKGTVLLDKSSDGNWAADVRVPYGERDVNFKFVVDGTWRHSDDLPKHQDEGGNVNNVFHVPTSAPEPASTSNADAVINTTEAKGAQTNGTGAAADANANADGNVAEQAAHDDGSDVTELTSTGVMDQHSQEQEERSLSSNIPTSLQELLGSMSVSNGTGDGSGGVQILNGNRRGYGANGYQQIDMSHAAYIKYLENAARAYPSPYLLQFTNPSEPTPPTDLQVACEYITIRHAAFMDNLERLTEQDRLKGTVPEPIGILKILPKIKEKYPNWTLSEKRLRKIIKDEDMLAQAERAARLAGELGGGRFQAEVVPVSSIDERLVEDLKGNPALQAARNKAATSANEQEKRELAARKARESLLGAEVGADKENTLPLPNTSGGSRKKGSKRAKSSASPTSGVLSAVGDAVASAAETAASAVSSALPAAPTSTRDEPKGPTNIVGDVDVKWYDGVKGKGVIASKRIKKHTVIFREDAFVFGPTRTIQGAINEGNGCGYCGKLFLGKASSIIVPCTAHDSIPANGGLAPAAANGQRKVSAGKKTTRSVSSSGTGKKGAQTESQLAANAVQAVAAGKGSGCNLKFCNKLCRDRCNESYSSLLCPVVNPSLSAFLKWCDESDGGGDVGRQGSLAVFKMYLRLIVASQRDGFLPADVSAASSATMSAPPLSGKEILDRLEALATISERTRKKRELNMFADMQMGEDWLTGFRLTLEALQLPEKYYTPCSVPGAPKAEGRPANPGETIQRSPTGALPDWYQKDLPVELADRILGFQNFLVWWGRVGLNQEDDGGIYILHPCINHDCEPNATVKRTPSMNNVGAKEAKPSKIYVVAHRDIERGEEITVTYVSPQASFEQRQGKLRASYLFDCFCGKCVAQAAEKGYTLKPREQMMSALPEVEDDDARPAPSTKSGSSKKKKSGKAKKSAAVPAPASANGAAETASDETSRPQTIQEQEQELFGEDSESTTPWYEDA